jgi:hypothetical protein
LTVHIPVCQSDSNGALDRAASERRNDADDQGEDHDASGTACRTSKRFRIATTIMEEIKETLLHGTIYCGIPSSLDAFKVANKALKEMGKVSAKPTK